MRLTARLISVVAVPLVLVGGAPAATGNGRSGSAAISGDGRFVAFASDASDLVAGDTNGVFDVFVRDRTRSVTERISLAPDGAQANARTGVTAISPDGRFVVMWSDATNLVSGDTNGQPDVFLRDRQTGTTERVSVGSGGVQAAGESGQGDVSDDGRIVALESNAANLGGVGPGNGFTVFVRDRTSGTTQPVGNGSMPELSADGRYVAYAESNGPIRVRDRLLGTTENVSIATDGAPLPGTGAVPTISANGRYVAFLMIVQQLRSRTETLYVRDRTEHTTDAYKIGIGSNPSISADGRFVVHMDEGVWIRDLVSGTTELISVSAQGAAARSGTSYSGPIPLSADSRFVAFTSLDSSLVAADGNGKFDVFVRDRRDKTTELVSVARLARLFATGLTLAPSRPAAGKLLTVAMPVATDGGPVAGGTVRCAAKVRKQALRAIDRGEPARGNGSV